MNQPTVSVVIPTYNHGALVCRAIDSVLAQALAPLEIIIVDDGSRDETQARLSEYMGRHGDKLVYRRTENKGAAAARNLGHHMARGDFVLPLDADDRLLPDGIAVLMHPIGQDPALDAVIGGCYSINAVSGQRKYRPAPALTGRRKVDFQAYLESRIAISHGRFVVRRRFFDQVQYPADFRNSEDISVFALLLATCNCRGVDQPVAEIYHQPASLRSNSRYARETGLKVVDAVFDDRVLPEDFFEFRPAFRRKRCLSLFRTLYRAGDYQAADRYYRQAVRESVVSLFQWSYFSKYIRMRLKTMGAAKGWK